MNKRKEQGKGIGNGKENEIENERGGMTVREVDRKGQVGDKVDKETIEKIDRNLMAGAKRGDEKVEIQQ